MSTGNDDDIKIYNKGSLSEISDFERLIENIDFNSSNGNKEKAEKLGAFLATLKPTDEALGIEIPKREMTAAVLYQSRVLITFLCGWIVKNTVPDLFLSDTIRNSMHDFLKENEYRYFCNIADGAAFSFYRVALNKNGEPAEIIGKEFAKLCGASKNSEIISLGESIYSKTADYAEALIKKCDFQY